MFDSIPASTLRTRDAYALLTQTLLPRPIAWVLTQDAEGTTNLAPFSYFTGVCSSPPTLLFTVANHRDGSAKDTLENLQSTGEMVVHIATVDQVDAVNTSSVAAPRGQSEVDLLGLETLPSSWVSPPRLKDAPIAMECKLSRSIEHGEGGGVVVVLAEILGWHIASSLRREDGWVDPEALRPLARLGGSAYAGLGEILHRDGVSWPLAPEQSQ